LNDEFFNVDDSFNKTGLNNEASLKTVAHLAWKRGVCCGRAAFDITFQQKTTLSFKTRNRAINFGMLPQFYISKIPPIYSISAIFAHKSRYAGFLHKSVQKHFVLLLGL